MKCKICKKKMLRIKTNYKTKRETDDVTVINVPAHHCPDCKNVVVDELVRFNINGFLYISDGNVLDYEECNGKNAVIIM